MDGYVHRVAPGDRDRGEAGVTGELLVFGRTEYAEPLTVRGTAAAGDDVLATHPRAWVELVVFPREAAHWIVRDGEDAESERTIRAG